MSKGLTKREGLILFWCEGDKPSPQLRKIQLTNSNPKILNYFVRWLETQYGVMRGKMKLRLHLWVGSNELVAKNYWANELGLPVSNFTKTWFKPKGTKNSHPNGICRVSVSSKELMERVRKDLVTELQN